jgi:hypothetical protein
MQDKALSGCLIGDWSSSSHHTIILPLVQDHQWKRRLPTLDLIESHRDGNVRLDVICMV